MADSVVGAEGRGATPPAPESHAADRAELLALLDREIEDANARGARSGWTLQAMLAAMIALAWFVLDELRGGIPDVVALVSVVVACSCILDAIAGLEHAFALYELPTEPRFVWRGRILARLPNIFALGIRDLLIAAAAVGWLSSPRPGLGWLAAIYFGTPGIIEVAMFLVTSALVKRGVPMPAQRIRRIELARLLGVALAVGLAIALAHTVAWTDSTHSIRVLLIGGATAIFLSLVAQLPDLGPDPSLVIPLGLTRRRLILGQCSVEDAARATDAIVVGLRTADAMEPHVDRVLRKCHAAGVAITSAHAALAKLNSMPTHAAEPTSRKRLDACRRQLRYVDKALESAGRRLTRLRIASRIIGIMLAAAREEAQAVVDRVEATVTQTESQREALAAEIERAAANRGRPGSIADSP